MITNKKKHVLLVMLLFCSVSYFSQTDTLVQKPTINYNTYLETVTKNNLGYAAEKFKVNISEANVQTAHVSPDPELELETLDNGERRMQMGYGFSASLNYTLELGGKRKARIDLAKSESELSKSLLLNFFQHLRADATLKYLEASRNKLLLDVQFISQKNMVQLAKADSVRYALGAISHVDARQSKLESQSMFNEVLQAESDWKKSVLEINVLMGNQPDDNSLIPETNFTKFDRHFNKDDLITSALNNRADLLAALQNRNVTSKLIRLEHANRVLDLGLNTGIGYSTEVRNIIATTPSFTSVSVGVSIPLKFSNKRNSNLKVAQLEHQQANFQYSETELKIQTEIIQAYQNYNNMKKQVEQFDNGMLVEAKSILEGKTYSYQRGETSVLEVLIAQRTYNETQQNYYETLYNYAASLVELERAAGIWDLDF